MLDVNAALRGVPVADLWREYNEGVEVEGGDKMQWDLPKQLQAERERLRLEATRRLPSSFPQPQPEPPKAKSKYLSFASASGVADPDFGARGGGGGGGGGTVAGGGSVRPGKGAAPRRA